MSVFSAESLQQRRELAYACRILAANGQNDPSYGHVTYREAGAQTFWMKPAALGLDEITPETLIRVDLEGTVVEGNCHVTWSFLSMLRFSEPDPPLPVSSIPTPSIRSPLPLQDSHYMLSHTKERSLHRPMSLASHVPPILSQLANWERKSPARWVEVFRAI